MVCATCGSGSVVPERDYEVLPIAPTAAGGEGALGAAGGLDFLVDKISAFGRNVGVSSRSAHTQYVQVNYLSNSPGGTFTGVNAPGGKLPGYSTA